MLTRRGLLRGLGVVLAAPVIVRVMFGETITDRDGVLWRVIERRVPFAEIAADMQHPSWRSECNREITVDMGTDPYRKPLYIVERLTHRFDVRPSPWRREGLTIDARA